MHDNNKPLSRFILRLSNSQLTGIFSLVFALAIIMGLIIYQKQLVEPELFTVGGLIVIIFLSGMYIFAQRLVQNLNDAYKRMELIAITDGLTQLYNKNHFMALFENELSRSIRHERNFSYFILQIDQFAMINDKYGYHIGNEILQDAAEVVKDNSRSTDIIARFGRDKFVCLLPETKIESALILSKRLRSIMEGETFSFGEHNETVPITICIGITAYEPSPDEEIDIHKIMNTADKALGMAREKGKNNEEYLVS